MVSWYMDDAIIRCENLVKIYKTQETEVLALQGLELEVARGELMAINGNSGSGKSTFSTWSAAWTGPAPAA